MRWKAPIFVARQLVKHQVGLSWNEVSRRYVKTEPELWWPEKWRKAAEKTLSRVVVMMNIKPLLKWLKLTKRTAEKLSVYVIWASLDGLCPEQARMFLP